MKITYYTFFMDYDEWKTMASPCNEDYEKEEQEEFNEDSMLDMEFELRREEERENREED